MKAISEGSYYITTTDEEGVKWYLDATGYLVDDEEFACQFKVSKSTGGGLYNEGLLIDPGNGNHFTNVQLDNDGKAVLHSEKNNIVLNMNKQSPTSFQTQYIKIIVY